MKKLFLSLLTLVTAATAACGFAACSMGKTGGGDTAAHSARSIQQEQAMETQPDIVGYDGTADGEFEFLPPDMQTQNGAPMPLPLPPQGRIFAPHIRHPEILHDAPMSGSAKDGATMDESKPRGKMPKRKDGRKGEMGDMVTPDGGIMPQVRDTDVKTSGDGSSSGSCPGKGCPVCPDGTCPDMQGKRPAPEKSATENSTEEKPAQRNNPVEMRGKGKKDKRKKPETKEKKQKISQQKED